MTWTERDSSLQFVSDGRTSLLVGLAGAVISLAALTLNSLRRTTGRVFMSVAMLLLHGAASVAYYTYAKHNGGDAIWYYYDPYNWGHRPFALGTMAVLQFTQYLRHSLGASYTDCYIFYQSIGFCGIMLLMRSFDEIHQKLRVENTTLSLYMLLTPSMYFWTSGIGKDAPLFFAVSLCVWSILSFRRRIPAFGLSIIVMILFRAHIALVVVTALAAAAFFHRGITTGRKIGLLALTSAAAVALAGSVRATVQVNVMDPNSISTFFQQRGDLSVSTTGATAVRNAPIIVRLLSLLFRPFFFDASGIFGVISSIENIGSLLLFAYLILHWRAMKSLARQVFFIEFCIFFAVILITLLTLVYYNVGLGIRERVMIFPPLFCAFIAQWGIVRSRSPQSRVARAPSLPGTSAAGRPGNPSQRPAPNQSQ